MATIRNTKKEIAYLMGEVISNCYLAIYFQGEKHRESLIDVINQAVETHNDLIYRVNHPAEKHNPRLVRKHFTALRNDMIEKTDELFKQISAICQS